MIAIISTSQSKENSELIYKDEAIKFTVFNRDNSKTGEAIKECLSAKNKYVEINDDEYYIVNRLNREKRIGTVEKIDDHHYRFSADVCDSWELVPWIRTFICRITEINFSNPIHQRRFMADLKKMYELYNRM